MGIIADARNDLRALMGARLPALTRAQRRRFVAALTDAGNEWLAKHDAQEAAAPVEFAATRALQFKAFTDALPDVSLGADPDET